VLQLKSLYTSPAGKVTRFHMPKKKDRVLILEEAMLRPEKEVL